MICLISKEMETIKTKKVLVLFNEKVEDLRRSRYFQSILKESSGFNFAFESDDKWSLTIKGPDDDAIKAFVLTFRYFIQDNERCSINNIAKIYNDEPYIPNEIKTEFNNGRKVMKQFLDSFSILQINKEGIQFKKILDVFFYGGLAHANEQKKELFDKWMKIPVVKGTFVSEFHLILGNIYSFLSLVENLNNKIISII